MKVLLTAKVTQNFSTCLVLVKCKSKLYKMDPNDYVNNGRLFDHKIDDNNSYTVNRINKYLFGVNKYGEFLYIHGDIYSHLKGFINRESYAKFLKISGLSEV